jgi:hypothetical protein
MVDLWSVGAEGLNSVRNIVFPALLLAALVVASAAASPAKPGPTAVSGAAAAYTLEERAVVSGSFLRLSSGQLRVSVWSGAARVRLTWRTAFNRTRSTTIRLRAGAGAAVLAAGSSHVVARALATRRMGPSVRVRLRPNPLLSDVDGNGTLDYRYDGDSDGRYEAVLFDDDRNGRFETIFLDAVTTSGLVKDMNQDGYFEMVVLDADRDGRPERLFYDGDADGYPEWQCLDLIGPDGAADSWVDTRVASGSPQQDRAANDLMVGNIVRLNQLRQLDPWSTGYMPYSPAPSLLRPYDPPAGRPTTPYPVPSS